MFHTLFMRTKRDGLRERKRTKQPARVFIACYLHADGVLLHRSCIVVYKHNHIIRLTLLTWGGKNPRSIHYYFNVVETIYGQLNVIATGSAVSLQSFPLEAQNSLSAPCFNRKAMKIRQPHITVTKSLDKSVSPILWGLQCTLACPSGRAV